MPPRDWFVRGAIPDLAQICAVVRPAAVTVLCSIIVSAPAHAELFACAQNSIRVFADGATGADAPLRSISGPSTGVDECYDVVYDSVHDEIFVAHGPVSVFAGGATGDVAPLRKIFGGLTGLGFAVSIAVDTLADELVVGSTGPNISAFSRTADGDVPAKRSFAPAGIGDPIALYVDRVRNEIVVSDYFAPNYVLYFAYPSGTAVVRNPIITPLPRGLYVQPSSGALSVASATTVPTYSHDGTPQHTLSTSLTSAWGLTGLGDGSLWVGNQSSSATDPDALLRFAWNGSSYSFIQQINNGAPASTNLYGVTSSRSPGCGAGHVACDVLFRTGFDVTYR